MAQSIIEDIDAAFFDGQRVCVAKKWPRECRHYGEQCQTAQQEKEKVAQSEWPLARRRVVCKKAQLREVEDISLRPAHHMEPDRRRQRKRNEPKPRIEKCQGQGVELLNC